MHHLPISTTFYFIQNSQPVSGGSRPKTEWDDGSSNLLPPILDVTSQEEKLCQARLTIVLNSYGDLCGMTTLGALEMGRDVRDGVGSEEESDEESGVGNALGEQYGVEELMSYLEMAQKVT